MINKYLIVIGNVLILCTEYQSFAGTFRSHWVSLLDLTTLAFCFAMVEIWAPAQVAIE